MRSSCGGERRLGQKALDALDVVPGVMKPILNEGIRFPDPVDVADEGILIGKQPFVQEGRFDKTVIEDIRKGDDDQDKAQQDGDECREDAPHPAFFGNGPVDGVEQDAYRRRPEDDVEEGQQHPEEKGGDADKQGEKGAVFRFPIGCQHGLTRVEGDGAAAEKRMPEAETHLFSDSRSIRRRGTMPAAGPATGSVRQR